MRIISGTLGGRRIQPPAQMPHTRPTTDIAREGLFNILQSNIELEGIKTLDLFGGTGCISYELASRGAKELTVVEKDPVMHGFIQKTAAQLGIENIKVLRLDVFKFLEHCTDRFDLVFAGPPYALGEIDRLPDLVFQQKILKKKGWFILEHTPRNSYTGHPYFKAERNYGTTVFSIFIEDRD